MSVCFVEQLLDHKDEAFQCRGANVPLTSLPCRCHVQELNDESFLGSEYSEYDDYTESEYGEMLSPPPTHPPAGDERANASPLDRSLDFDDVHIMPPGASREDGLVCPASSTPRTRR